MTYCSAPDLLIGDLPITGDSAELFIQAAAEEIDMQLASEFLWPPTIPLVPQTELILKRINVLIGTGRLVMAQAVGAEELSTHAYGTYLLREGQSLLAQVMCGELVLEGIDKNPLHTTGNAPSITNEDSIAGVDAFYGFAMRGEPSFYRPGI